MHTRDGHIVHQCLSGNTETFALLVDKYKERIFALVYAKVGQFQDAEDLTQDVFLEAYKNLSTLRRWDNFYPWLYSIASNQCKNYHRAQKRQVVTVHLANQDENHRMDVEAHSEKLKNERVHDALASLPEMHRQVLMLRYMAGMKSKEIAETLRVSPNTIDQRLVRARAKLKTILSEEMIPMIRTAFAERRLQPGFTARVVELISDAKIQTAPHKTALPLGLSAAGGVILLLLILSFPHSPLYPLGEWLGGSLPLNTQVVEDGDLPVDAQATRVAILGAEGEDGDFGRRPKPLKAATAINQTEEITTTGIILPNDASWDMDISPDGTKMVYLGRGVTSLGYEFQLIVSPLVDASSDVSPKQTVLVQGEGATTQYFQPKWSPNGMWVAFYRQEHQYPRAEGYGSDIDLYLIPAAGGRMRFLARTDSQKHSRGLSWPPDSKEIAFVKWTGENTDISIVSLDTGVVRPFTTDGKGNTSPSWSPDGNWIFYLSQRPSSRETYLGKPVWKQPVDGGVATPINVVAIQDEFVYSPNGKWVARNNIAVTNGSFSFPGIAVDHFNEHGDLAGDPILLEPEKFQYAPKLLRWTPGGKIIILQEDRIKVTYAALKTKSGTLCYRSEAAYFNVQTKSGARRYLNTDTSIYDVPRFPTSIPLFPLTDPQLIGVQWLSGGNRLFFPSSVNLPGSGARCGILDIETNRFTRSQLLEFFKEINFDESALSPDEKQIAFVIMVKHPETKRQLYIIPVPGGAPRQLTHGESWPFNLRWSPDGRTIAFINGLRRRTEMPSSPESQLCVVSVSDGKLKILADSGMSGEPAWSPDGTTLAYKKSPPDNIHIVPATGGQSRQITNTPNEGESEIHWTPDGKQITYKTNDAAWWVISINGGQPKKLHRNYIPSSWSSDGATYHAFGPHGKLQRVSSNGAIPSELSARAPMNARPLSMSPDGETILLRQVDSVKSCWSIDVSHLDSQ
ncbi:MAG: sigma-70 family RNA polymerase sigma factor [Candidatus Poribacteria bacterium]|nr:sigma-70 family RNA polymerase sigma factor [Candidatus Poribacteria bacterium]